MIITAIFQLILMAAKIQKQKDQEAANEKTRTEAPVIKPHEESSHKHVVVDDGLVVRSQGGEEDESCRLQRISDRVDECLSQAQRVEQHWNDNFQTILALLQCKTSEKKSYV